MKNRLLLLAIGALVVAVAVAVLGGDSAPSDREGTAGGIDLHLAYLDGTTGSLADFGGRPVVLNFWASWCPACVAELPDFAEVHREFGDEVVFIGVNMQEVDPSAADALIDAAGVTYLLADDPDGAIFRRFGGIAMPTSVFITADGEVADVHGGAIFADDLTLKIRRELLGS